MDYTDYEKLNIQWYPGHMTKAVRMIEENLKLVDAVCEIIDARIPLSSRNPDINEIVSGMPRMIIINRSDLADPAATAAWKEYFIKKGLYVLVTDSRTGKGVSAFAPMVREMLADKLADSEEKGMVGRPLRVMIIGIPNVGKSTFINKVANRKAAITGDKPGVTRGKQWIAIDQGLEMLDTPGILWPKFDSQEVGEMLAITKAIKGDILDIETLAANFMLRLKSKYPEALRTRYKIEPDEEASGYDLLEMAAKKRVRYISYGRYINK